jgi:hypothetical protein
VILIIQRHQYNDIYILHVKNLLLFQNVHDIAVMETSDTKYVIKKRAVLEIQELNVKEI